MYCCLTFLFALLYAKLRPNLPLLCTFCSSMSPLYEQLYRAFPPSSRSGCCVCTKSINLLTTFWLLLPVWIWLNSPRVGGPLPVCILGKPPNVYLDVPIAQAKRTHFTGICIGIQLHGLTDCKCSLTTLRISRSIYCLMYRFWLSRQNYCQIEDVLHWPAQW